MADELANPAVASFDSSGSFFQDEPSVWSLAQDGTQVIRVKIWSENSETIYRFERPSRDSKLQLTYRRKVFQLEQGRFDQSSFKRSLSPDELKVFSAAFSGLHLCAAARSGLHGDDGWGVEIEYSDGQRTCCLERWSPDSDRNARSVLNFITLVEGFRQSR